MITSPANIDSNLGVRVRGVSRTFPGGVRAVDDVSLDIPDGQFLALLGPSGCGKSTLLRIIAGLDRPDHGTIKIASAAEPDPQMLKSARIGFVFQDAHLLPWRTVRRNVELPLELLGVAAADRRRAADALLADVGLADALERYPAQLSGGMKMRASLARALVTEPRLLLLDEPFAALDEITRHRLDAQLLALTRQRGTTTIFVTHSVQEATFLADHAVVFAARPARVVWDQRIALPRERTPELRTSQAFAQQARMLFDALSAGEARR